MTERTLKEAIKIKEYLDHAREIKKDIEEKRGLCTGNTSEVNSRRFELSIFDGVNIRKINISSEAAYKALDIDFKNTYAVVGKLETELEQLN